MTIQVNLTSELGKNIRKRRILKGMTQESLAEKIGICNQGLSRIENGVMAPKINRLPTIAVALDCTVADLFRREDDVAVTETEEIISILRRMDEKTSKEIIPAILKILKVISLR